MFFLKIRLSPFPQDFVVVATLQPNHTNLYSGEKISFQLWGRWVQLILNSWLHLALSSRFQSVSLDILATVSYKQVVDMQIRPTSFSYALKNHSRNEKNKATNDNGISNLLVGYGISIRKRTRSISRIKIFFRLPNYTKSPQKGFQNCCSHFFKLNFKKKDSELDGNGVAASKHFSLYSEKWKRASNKSGLLKFV